ncbi:hypothetical protein scyTo_0003905 [Scyliorhinus torazame]|uniref:Uncharacterized protein n=1 Tax=Scyliorhinus torazame TaxID=75743 RepID=A0A401PNV1_SCYTO|nr:hypothetical protein [Scyliorhinus torazame]
MDGINQMRLPVVHMWHLNELCYDGLTSLEEGQNAPWHCEEHVRTDAAPLTLHSPPWTNTTTVTVSSTMQCAYEGLQCFELLTYANLKDTIPSNLSFWDDVLMRGDWRWGKRDLISAHGNHLWGIVRHLKGVSDAAIMELNLSTKIPIVFELDANLKLTCPIKFLGDEVTIKTALEAIASEWKCNK